MVDESKGLSLKDKASLTGEEQIKRLREAVSPPGRKGTWLKIMNDRQLAEVYHRMKIGQSAYKIVQIAQGEWGLQRKAEPKSLARAVRKFKSDVLGEIVILETGRTPEIKKEGKQLRATAVRAARSLNGLDRMRWLINIQTERIALLYEREQKSMPFRFTDKSVEVLGDLLDKYMDLQIRLGIVDSKPEEISLSIHGKFSHLLGSGAIPTGTVVVDWASRFLEKCEGRAVVMKMDSNGNYSFGGVAGVIEQEGQEEEDEGGIDEITDGEDGS